MNMEVRTEIANPLNSEYLIRLKAFALESLGPMFDRRKVQFHFRVRKTANGVLPEGNSRRYTAITLIGLSGEDGAVRKEALSGITPEDVYTGLLESVDADKSVGDVALIAWAGTVLGHKGSIRALDRLRAFRPAEATYPTVELSWTLAALCQANLPEDDDLRETIANRLKESFRTEALIFPHIVGNSGNGPRSHVSCFADLVYPVQALSMYSSLSGDNRARETAERCARHFCRLQGSAGQWWWHYDVRSGKVLEGYPVYAVHQDAMAPMALFALEDAGGTSFRREILQGLEWLRKSPELNGGSLIDERNGVIWRKVARAEPGKLSRYLQATAARINPDLRVPGLDVLFPPRIVDFEDRPYHIGWVLYAWPESRVLAWRGEGAPK